MTLIMQTMIMVTSFADISTPSGRPSLFFNVSYGYLATSEKELLTLPDFYKEDVIDDMNRVY